MKKTDLYFFINKIFNSNFEIIILLYYIIFKISNLFYFLFFVTYEFLKKVTDDSVHCKKNNISCIIYFVKKEKNNITYNSKLNLFEN